MAISLPAINPPHRLACAFQPNKNLSRVGWVAPFNPTKLIMSSSRAKRSPSPNHHTPMQSDVDCVGCFSQVRSLPSGTHQTNLSSEIFTRVKIEDPWLVVPSRHIRDREKRGTRSVTKQTPPPPSTYPPPCDLPPCHQSRPVDWVAPFNPTKIFPA